MPFISPNIARPIEPRPAAPDPYAPLRLYDGTWRVRRVGGGVDRLVNHCARVGRYFACEQTVNDVVAALVLFVPTDTAGRYATQGVRPDGIATGRGALVIDDSHWTYDGQGTDIGKTTYYRTVNTFTGPDHIHFEVSRSNDHAHWTTTLAGDEERVVPSPPAAPGAPPA